MLGIKYSIRIRKRKDQPVEEVAVVAEELQKRRSDYKFKIFHIVSTFYILLSTLANIDGEIYKMSIIK